MHYFEAESSKFFCGGGKAHSTAPPLPNPHPILRLQRLAPYLPTPSTIHNSHTVVSLDLSLHERTHVSYVADILVNQNIADFVIEKRNDDECKSYVKEANKLHRPIQFDLSLEFCPRRRPTRIPCKLEGDAIWRMHLKWARLP